MIVTCGPPRRRSGVEALLVDEQIDASGFKFLQRRYQVRQRSAEPVYVPRSQDFVLAADGRFERSIKAWSLVAAKPGPPRPPRWQVEWQKTIPKIPKVRQKPARK